VEILDLWPIAHYLVSPGGATETIALFLGRVNAPESGGIFGLDGEGEHIRVHVLPEANVRRMLDESRIENAQTIIAAQWFFLNRDAILAKWA
jgi:ADP-ribose pyrophosphatase